MSIFWMQSNIAQAVPNRQKKEKAVNVSWVSDNRPEKPLSGHTREIAGVCSEPS